MLNLFFNGKLGELERDLNAFDWRKILSEVCKSVFMRRALSSGDVDGILFLFSHIYLTFNFTLNLTHRLTE
jgi:hypothetical protein